MIVNLTSEGLGERIFLSVGTTHNHINYAFHIDPPCSYSVLSEQINYHCCDLKSSLIVLEYDHRLAHEFPQKRCDV